MHDDALGTMRIANRLLLQSRFGNVSLDMSGLLSPQMQVPQLARGGHSAYRPAYAYPPDDTVKPTRHPSLVPSFPSDSTVQRAMPSGHESRSDFESAARRSRSDSESDAQERRQGTTPDEAQLRNVVMRGIREGKLVMFMVFVPICICMLVCIVSMGVRDHEAVQSSGQLDLGHGLTPAVRQAPLRFRYPPLCKELQAPERDQCSISVPSLADLPQSQADLVFNIVSKVGKPIVQVKVKRTGANGLAAVDGDAPAAPSSVLERIELMAVKRQKLLGSCELRITRRQADAQPEIQCTIYDGDGDRFASLEQDNPEEMTLLKTEGYKSFTLSSNIRPGWNMQIQGDVAKRSLTVLDKNKRQISVTLACDTVQPSNGADYASLALDFYKLRIQPGVDGGAVLAALLAIDRWPGMHEPPGPREAAI